jgi:hypothetical protein
MMVSSVSCMKETTTYKMTEGVPGGKRQFRRPRHKRKKNIQLNL